MAMSTIPTSFSESAVSSSSELSDELTTALAAGRWWAIMEVSSPISEEPEYGDLTSVQWWGTMEAGESSCPTSLAFSDESGKTESPYSGVSDETLNTKDPWRQKKTQSAPMPPRSQKGAPVPACTEKRDHTSPLVFSNASEKTESLYSGFSDAMLKTTERQRKWRQKKPQGPRVLARSEKAECGDSPFSNAALKTSKQVRQKKLQVAPVAARSPQGAPVPARSPQGAPVPFRSPQGEPVPARSPPGAPVPVRSPLGASVPARSPQGALVPSRSPQGAPVPNRSPPGAPVPFRSPQGAPVPTRSPPGAPVPTRSPPGAPVPARSPLGASVPARSPQGAPVPNRSPPGAPVPNRSPPGAPVPARSPLGAPVPARSPQGAPVLARTPKRAPVPSGSPQEPPVHTGSQQRGKLRIPEHLRKHLLRAAGELGAPVPAKSPQGAPVPTKSLQREPVPAPEVQNPEPLRQELQQQKPQASSVMGAPMPNKTPVRQRLKIPEPLRQELLQLSRRASSVREDLVPNKTPERQRLKIPEPLRQELLLLSRRASSVKGEPMLKKTPERQRLKIPQPLRQELLQLSSRASSVKEEPMPKKTAERQRLKIQEPLRQELLQLSARAEKGAAMPKNTVERQRLKIPERLRKELLQQKPPATAQGLLMSSNSPREAPVPDGNPVHADTPQGAGVFARSPPAEAVPTGCLKGAVVLTRTMKAGKRRLEGLNPSTQAFSSTRQRGGAGLTSGCVSYDYRAEGCMGPVVMPPGKKAEGPSSGSVARGLSQLYQDTEAADLSLALSASLSRAEDEELTSLSWLHESTDLLTSLGHSGLRSVSPLQDANGGREPSSSPSSSPEPSEPPYHLSTGPSRKPPYSFSCLIFMAIEDAPSKRLPVKDIYGWILEHFPYFASAPTGWKNSVRHNLSLNKCFKKVDKDRSQSIGKGSLWSIDPDYRHNLIQALKKTPYHPYSPRLPKPSTSPSASPQQYHRPTKPQDRQWDNEIRNVMSDFSSVNPNNTPNVKFLSLKKVMPMSSTMARESTLQKKWRSALTRSALGDYLTRGKNSLRSDSPPPSDDQQEDHTYSSSQSLNTKGDISSSLSSCSTQGSLSAYSPGQEVTVTEVKEEQKDFPLDATPPPSQLLQRRRLLWTKGHLRTPGDTLPLKKRRAEKLLVKEEEDEEMKEAAGSLLHLAGVRTGVNKNAQRYQITLPKEETSRKPINEQICLVLNISFHSEGLIQDLLTNRVTFAPNLYKAVMDDVISEVRELFLDEGVDEQVLMELKTSAAATAATLALPAGVAPFQQLITPQGQILQVVRAANGAQYIIQPQQQMLLQQQVLPQMQPGGVQAPVIQQVLTPLQGGLSQQTGVIIQPQQIVLTGNKVQQNTQASQQPPMVLQVDGAGDTSSEEDEEEEDEYDEDEDEDKEKDGGEDGQVEEEPLNSGDDVSDEEDQELFDTENVVVCQYDKIHRSKNKWKFHLKDGIMNLNGRDYVFSKAIGDAEWLCYRTSILVSGIKGLGEASLSECNGQYNGYLLGDRGYPCLPYLMTPYPEPDPGPQTRFNLAHSRTRAKVEMTIGILKSRFQCLRGLRVSPERACDIIVACVVLHNIATIRGESHPACIEEDGPEEPLQIFAHNRDGRLLRDRICQNYFY
ncbi:forkhead box N3-like protein [Labeo rohita]|uniref:Forkhead box protein N3 n=2 Tax=Clupeocephala TaxID=186625 RepID=A0A498MER0_LABRO|nr:forkhead box N3-like protein [Labeo rohita]